jgi:hypothetical protein
LQKIWENALGVKPHLLFSLGSHSKQAGDEYYLTHNISFCHPSHLSFPNHVHDLISLECSPCSHKRNEAHPWLDQPFDEAVILLDEIIQVFDLSEFDRWGKHSAGFELCNGFGKGGVLIDINDAGSRPADFGVCWDGRLDRLLLDHTSVRNRSSERFDEEAFGSLGIASRAQEKLERVADRESTAR